MTNISFLSLAQIRAKFRLFLLSWSVFYFQFTRSILGEQVSLNKNFCSALGYIFVLLFDNFFIFLTDFQLSILRFFLSLLVKHFQTFSKTFQTNFTTSLLWFMCTNFLHPEHEKIQLILQRKLNQNQNNFLKFKSKLNHKLKKNFQNKINFQSKTKIKISEPKPKLAQEIS